MFSTSDTIVAIATPPGRGGLGVVRLSGTAAADIAASLLRLDTPLQPRRATFGRTAGDQVVATWFAAPHSYTGEHVVEISAHGSPVILRQIVEQTLEAGARLAEPGEFTLRAFLNGRIDLVQAEAVADLIDAVTPLQARIAFDQLEGTLTERIADISNRLFDLIARLEASLDFPDEGYHFVEPVEAAKVMQVITSDLAALVCDARRGRLIREGARVVLAGKPNVGKSSLFNTLLRAGRAIVTPVAGTTRDVLTEKADVDGLLLELTDTAGVRNSEDAIEIEGVARARRALATADLAIVVLDRSNPLDSFDEELLAQTASMPHLVVANKCDLPPAWGPPSPSAHGWIEVSAIRGDGMEEVRREIRRTLEGASGVERDAAAVTNIRHAALLERAHHSMTRACDSVSMPGGPAAEEFVLTDLQEARAALEEVTGARTSEDLLRHIFSRFCIGK